MTFFGCEDPCDTNIPNSSEISYRHHVPAATLLCLNVYCQYVLSSMANFSKFHSELWLVWKQVSEEWNETIWISQLKERLLPYLMPESPRGKNDYNYINHGKRPKKTIHIFAHQSIHSKRQSQQIKIHSFLCSQTSICLQIIISMFLWKALVILFLFLLWSAPCNRINMPVWTVGQRWSWYGTADGIANVASGRMHLRNYANEIWIKKCFVHYCSQSVPFLRTKLT